MHLGLADADRTIDMHLAPAAHNGNIQSYLKFGIGMHVLLTKHG